ncbi:uncharacterized protein LOC126908539 [Daktulosphaira vitifoliae]|uniref:uncharacterized protein LOC126908539 n=1 Tax=Daktulosphaira vitifoliae TaxID=58002 RepID=UPI0021AAF459|nr:uncharacterized protein LOC126908539 [Daktulosphaira vitifoliae]
MFSIKFHEFCVLLLYVIVVFVGAPNFSTQRNAAIINSICENDGWQHFTDVESVKYDKQTFELSNITVISDRISSNKKVQAAALFLLCTYANDLKKIFYMVIYYCHECQRVFIQEKDPYECTSDLLKIIKKITLLATVMKESLISLDALYGTPLKSTTDDYILYCYLSNLQKVENTIFREAPSENNPNTCNQILENIKFIFPNMIEDINVEIKRKPKNCNFNTEILSAKTKDYKKVFKITNKQKKNFSFENLNNELDNEIKKIVIEKYYKLGFYFNPEIQMIDVPIPQEVLDNNQMKPPTTTPYLVEIEKKKKTQKGVTELLNFLEQAKDYDNKSTDEKLDPTGLIGESSSQKLNSPESSKPKKKLKI